MIVATKKKQPLPNHTHQGQKKNKMSLLTKLNVTEEPHGLSKDS
jgi:hypothetical protein